MQWSTTSLRQRTKFGQTSDASAVRCAYMFAVIAVAHLAEGPATHATKDAAAPPVTELRPKLRYGERARGERRLECGGDVR